MRECSVLECAYSIGHETYRTNHAKNYICHPYCNCPIQKTKDRNNKQKKKQVVDRDSANVTEKLVGRIKSLKSVIAVSRPSPYLAGYGLRHLLSGKEAQECKFWPRF